jgi:entericidin B
MKKSVLVILALVSVALFSACNTMKGLGKDIEKGGQAIERKASD